MPIDQSTAFVSYSREDVHFVLRLAKDLKAKGAKVWMDKLDIRPGQRWEAEIETAVEACSRMLVVLSPAAIASKNVLAEASLAIDEGKEVVPVLYQECKVPFRLRPFQYADFRTNYDEGLQELVSGLGSQPAPASTAVSSASSISKTTTEDANLHNLIDGTLAAENLSPSQDESSFSDSGNKPKPAIARRCCFCRSKLVS